MVIHWKNIKDKNLKYLLDDNSQARKNRVWIIFLLLGVICITLALTVDLKWIKYFRLEALMAVDLAFKIKCAFWSASSGACGNVITYETVLAAVVLFFYGVIDNRRLGVPYRRLAAYTIGSRTIPVLFVVTWLLSLSTYVFHYLELRHTVYAIMLYVLGVQTFVIVQILMSTSYRHCKKIICRVERKKYMTGLKLEENYDDEWFHFLGHLERAIHSDEFISDKKELLADFLRIPISGQNGKKINADWIGQEYAEFKKQERLYEFYFFNILFSFQNFDKDENNMERNQLYKAISDFILCLSDEMKMNNATNGEYPSVTEQIYHMIISGIMNGLLASNAEKSWKICDKIFSGLADILPSEVFMQQLQLFVLFQELLAAINSDISFRTQKIEKMCIWRPIQTKDLSFLSHSWEVWTNLCTISDYEKIRRFGAAIDTMSGRRNSSNTIFWMLMAVKGTEENGRVAYGKKHVSKSTAVKKQFSER
ncbi:hypothetical protein D7V94_15400 [Parablautia intestinalis]|jgi:hypothetical protein|uniref:Uncharacterized protein n=1 Tax=Parablautia intestinalis TaxID=2320100 RepID=A0A3A9AR49_9FIRM|nr:hypothetical protein [Parablautia intestinalis]MCI8616412.1 hypothetical protein [Lachnospiraceae bacterium]RKI90013.1 hypothetical protein D7V94_15400 [Parablautia intestinalis]